MPLFRSLHATRIQQLDTQCTWRRADRGQWMINCQDTSTDVFFVVSGKVHVKLQSVSGREVLLREISAGEYFGEIAGLDNLSRSAGIVSLTDVVVARMPASVFLAVVHAHPDVCNQLLTLLAGQIRSLVNRVNEFTTLDGRHRIYSELLRLAKADAGKPGVAIVSPPPSHSQIAARVSIRREAVAREIKALERSGLIERRRGALVLTDTARLQQMIDAATETE